MPDAIPTPDANIAPVVPTPATAPVAAPPAPPPFIPYTVDPVVAPLPAPPPVVEGQAPPAPIQRVAATYTKEGVAGTKAQNFGQEIRNLITNVKLAEQSGVVAPPELAAKWGDDSSARHSNYGAHPPPNVPANPVPLALTPAQQEAQRLGQAEAARFEALVAQDAARNNIAVQPGQSPLTAVVPAAQDPALATQPVVAAPVVTVPAPVVPEAAPVVAQTPVETEEQRQAAIKIRPQNEDEAQILKHAEFLRREAVRQGNAPLSVFQSLELATRQLGEASAQVAPVIAPLPVIEPPAAPQGPSAQELAQQAQALELEGFQLIGEFKNEDGVAKVKAARELQTQAQAAAQAEQAYQQQYGHYQEQVAHQAYLQESYQAYNILPALKEDGPVRQAYTATYQRLVNDGDPAANSPLQIVARLGIDIAAGRLQLPSASAPIAAQPAPVAIQSAPAVQAAPVVAPVVAPPAPAPRMAATPPQPALLPPPVGRGSAPAPAASNPILDAIQNTPNRGHDFNALMKTIMGRRAVAVRG